MCQIAHPLRSSEEEWEEVSWSPDHHPRPCLVKMSWAAWEEGIVEQKVYVHGDWVQLASL